MVGSKMSLSMVGWEGLLRSSIRIRGSPSLKATVELRFARRMGEKQYVEDKVGRIKGEKKNPAYFRVCLRPALLSHLLHSHRADTGTQTSIPHTPCSHAAPMPPSMPQQSSAVQASIFLPSLCFYFIIIYYLLFYYLGLYVLPAIHSAVQVGIWISCVSGEHLLSTKEREEKSYVMLSVKKPPCSKFRLTWKETCLQKYMEFPIL